MRVTTLFLLHFFIIRKITSFSTYAVFCLVQIKMHNVLSYFKRLMQFSYTKIVLKNENSIRSDLKLSH